MTERKYDKLFQKMEPEDLTLPENAMAARTVTIEAMNEFHRQNPALTISLLTRGNKDKGFVMAEDDGKSVSLHPLTATDMKTFGFFAGLHQPQSAEVETRERLQDIFDDIARCHPAGVPVYDMDAIEEKRREMDSKSLMFILAAFFMTVGFAIMAALVGGGQTREVHVAV